MPLYVVTYFDVRGRAEPIRILLTYVGADWKDNRIPFKGIGQSPLPDDIKAKCTFGQVPLLEVDGQRLNQTLSIMRYIGRRYNLAGQDDLEAAKIDEIADGVHDFVYDPALLKCLTEQDEQKKAEMLNEATKNSKTKFLSVFNKLAEANGGFLVGNSRSWADVYAAYTIDIVEHMGKISLTDDFPALKKLINDILSEKNVKEYIANRPVTPFWTQENLVCWDAWELKATIITADTRSDFKSTTGSLADHEWKVLKISCNFGRKFIISIVICLWLKLSVVLYSFKTKF